MYKPRDYIISGSSRQCSNCIIINIMSKVNYGVKAYKRTYFSVNYRKEDDYRDKFFVYFSSFSLQLLEVSQIAYSETFTACTALIRNEILHRPKSHNRTCPIRLLTDLILGKAFCTFIFFRFPDSRLSVLNGLHFYFSWRDGANREYKSAVV